MTVNDLQNRLEKEGVDPEAYSLSGGSGWNDRYCLAVRNGKWVYYFAERGLETGYREFATEAEACEYFWDCISRDPTVRRGGRSK
jgi:hypothetical protein